MGEYEDPSQHGELSGPQKLLRELEGVREQTAFEQISGVVQEAQARLAMPGLEAEPVTVNSPLWTELTEPTAAVVTRNL